jgi:hypothetical protein
LLHSLGSTLFDHLFRVLVPPLVKFLLSRAAIAVDRNTANLAAFSTNSLWESLDIHCVVEVWASFAKKGFDYKMWELTNSRTGQI